MLTQEEVLRQVKAGRGSQYIDGRDFARLATFFPIEEATHFGVRVKDGVKPEDVPILPFTEERIKKALASDLKFAFEKALDRRGISAFLMYEVVKMWLWVLEDELQDFEAYEQYGLPLLRAVALKYGLPNPIGDDAGDEEKYSSP